jgi:hypothetical protein
MNPLDQPKAPVNSPVEERNLVVDDMTVVSRQPSISESTLPESRATETANQPGGLPSVLLRVFDLLLSLCAILLAVVLASFAARNSDLWLHLGTGKALVSGTYTFGSHPFTYTGDNSYWVNNSWLSDLLFYGMYTLAGVAGLVALKAFLVGLVAVVMIGASRSCAPRRPSLLLPALCAVLGVLAMAPWLLMRSLVISYLFLPLTVLLLEKGTQGWRRYVPPSAPIAGRETLIRLLRCYWPVLVLFALWVNLDVWFLLGPLTVALYAVGGWLGDRKPRNPTAEKMTEGRDTNEPASLGNAWWLLTGLGLAACLFNPHFILAFQLPILPGFSASADLLQQDPHWWNLGASPLSNAYIWPEGNFNVSAVAYFSLLVLGGLSFHQGTGVMSWSRLLVLAVFALLSLYQAHMVPFFAVTAVPIIAMNLQEISTWQSSALRLQRGPARALVVVTRPLALVATAGLLVAAWPGWLQPTVAESRCWDAPLDPSLETGAIQLAGWRQVHLTTGMNGFHSSLDLANYCAWFCPDEKTYLNGSLHGGREVVAQYLTLRRELVTGQPGGLARRGHPSAPSADARWPQLLEQHQVGYVVVYVAEGPEIHLTSFVFAPERWFPAYLQGGIAIFGRKDRENEKPLACPLLDLDALAFAPSAENHWAPAAGSPAAYPPAPDWWRPLPHSASQPNLMRDQALTYVTYFAAMKPKFASDRQELWHGSRVGLLIGDWATRSLGPGCALAESYVRLSTLPWTFPPAGQIMPPLEWLSLTQREMFGVDRDCTPAVPQLAVRAARQAIAHDPHDALAYALLGEAYSKLYSATQEQFWEGGAVWFNQMRLYQIAAAYHEAVRLNPGLALAHLRLRDLYTLPTVDFPELRLKHTKEYLRCLLKTLPPSALDEEYEREVGKQKDEIEVLDKLIKSQESEFEERTAHKGPRQRLKVAQELRLVNKALQILANEDLAKLEVLGEDENVATLEKQATELKLRLFLKVGQPNKARAWLQKDWPRLERVLGAWEYNVLLFQVEATLGNYQVADMCLERLSQMSPTEADFVNEPTNAMPVLVAANPWGAPFTPASLIGMMAPRVFQEQSRSQVFAMRGILALEQGNITRAEGFFVAALANWQTEHPLDFSGRMLAEGYWKLIKANKHKATT